MYLIKLQGLLIGLGLIELPCLIYPRLSTGFGMLVFFTNLRLMELHVRYLALPLILVGFLGICLVLDGRGMVMLET